jgi:hypothetical protein
MLYSSSDRREDERQSARFLGSPVIVSLIVNHKPVRCRAYSGTLAMIARMRGGRSSAGSSGQF